MRNENDAIEQQDSRVQSSFPLLASQTTSCLPPCTNDLLGPMATSAAVVTTTLPTTTTTAAPVLSPRTTTTTEEKEETRHLSSVLARRLLGDVVVACGVTLGVAPFLMVVDKAIVERAAGTRTVSRSVLESASDMARRPLIHARSPALVMMWGVYAATYAAANTLDTFVDHRSAVASSSSDRVAAFIGTTVVNSAATLYKDRAYARMFGTASVASRAVPPATYALWATRDCLVVGSSFVAPRLFDDGRHRAMAQFVCPVLTQAVAGPAQLLGLDLYNRPLHHLDRASAIRERLSFLRANFFSVLGARVARIIPAYSVGGVGNTYFRTMWRERTATTYY